MNRRFFTQKTFDTFKFVQKLELEGISREAAEGCMASLDEVVSDYVMRVSKESVSKQEYENIIYAQRVDLDKIRSEMHLMEKNEFSLIKSENSRMARDLEKLRIHISEELRRAQSDVRFELSMEKVKNTSKI